MGDDLPIPGMHGSRMFYFNIKGSMNKKNVKLVAFLSTRVINPTRSEQSPPNQCVYFDNDNTQTWQSMKYYPKKWNLPTKYHLSRICCDFWV